MPLRLAPIVCLLGGVSPALGQLFVTEVMYDPVSNEDRWEWIEVYNTGPAAIDLDGVVLDRVGDRERAVVAPNIVAEPLVDGETVANPTIVPAGGVAVLYNGPGLNYQPSRFLSAWPETPLGTTLIGVEGWSSNQLANRPDVSDYAPSLPALTMGFWPDESAYRQDVADFGDASTRNRRVFRTDHAMTAFGYDDSPPWIDTLGRSSLIYVDGPVFQASSWLRTNYPHGGARESRPTFVPEPTNGPDHGSPGVAAPGSPPGGGLVFTELMVNPASVTGASNEWEWIEVYNAGPEIDLTANPLWLDDDDGSPLDEPNVTGGLLPSGGVAVLFNASAASRDDFEQAWRRPGGEPIQWIAVDEWPTLANAGDSVAIWDSGSDYSADRAGDTPTTSRSLVAIDYDDSAPWPTGVDGDAIRLTNLSADPTDPAAWARARGAGADPDAYEAREVFRPGGVPDNLGGEQASPGFVWPDIVSPLPGDYNGDGRVDAADYVMWRNGAALPTETVSAGVTDAADLAVWREHYGRSTTAAAVAAPEPATALLVGLAGLLTFAARAQAEGAGVDRFSS